MTLANPTKAEVLQAIQDLDADDEMTEVIIAALEKMIGAQVYVNVSGGVAETTVTRGPVEVIHVDWDDVKAGDLEFAREVRERIEQVDDEEYRTRLLADIDREIRAFEADEEDQRIADLIRTKTERLRRLEIVMEEMGGRGVDVAEEIDTLRSELEELYR